MIRVLIVEDDAPLRTLSRIILEETGRYEIVGEAEDGQEGIALAKKVAPDVIFLDLAMPVMGGLDALPHLREACPEAKIVIVTMLQREGIETEAIRLGASGFIDKGLDSEEFVLRLDAILRSSSRAPRDQAQRWAPRSIVPSG